MKRGNTVVYAGLGVRFFAWVTDMAVLLVPLTVLRAVRWWLSLLDPAGYWVRYVLFRYSRMDIAVYLLTALYFILTTYSFGATPGKRLLRLRVVSAEDRPLRLREVVLRETVGRYLTSVVFMLGYLGILLDREHRALHDVIADTRVVYAPVPAAYPRTGTRRGPAGPPEPAAAVPVEPVSPEPVSPEPAGEAEPVSWHAGAGTGAGEYSE